MTKKIRFQFSLKDISKVVKSGIARGHCKFFLDVWYVLDWRIDACRSVCNIESHWESSSSAHTQQTYRLCFSIKAIIDVMINGKQDKETYTFLEAVIIELEFSY